MSRAFMKEGEAPEPRCPSCDALGAAVGPATLDVHVPADLRTALGDRAYYCATPACRNAYFNGWGTVVTADRITGRTWPKDPDGPLCPCFGLKPEDIVADARLGKKIRVQEIREEADAPDARCPGLSPDGRSCVTPVMRLFRENFQSR